MFSRVPNFGFPEIHPTLRSELMPFLWHFEFLCSSVGVQEVNFLDAYSLLSNRLVQRFFTCGPRTRGGPRLFRKLNTFSQQINKVYIRKKAKSGIENFKTLCKSEGI
jgi:hypothetical protein